MRTLFAHLIILLPAITVGETYNLPPLDVDLIGSIRVTEALHEDTLLDVALRYDIGQEEILRANPDVDRWLPGEKTEITIPSRYVLPSAPRRGLVVNVPEMRIYYYPDPEPGQPREIHTYPVSIGRMDWATPLGETRLVARIKDPVWTPPESIRKEHEADGDPLPKIVPAGPDNPLGRYALKLNIPGYLIHSTNKLYGVGMRVSHGCIRMLPEDMERLFPMVTTRTPVRIINQPAKAGWLGDLLFLEVHPPLEEDHSRRDALVETVMDVIHEAKKRQPVKLSIGAIKRAIDEQSGIPVLISQVE